MKRIRTLKVTFKTIHKENRSRYDYTHYYVPSIPLSGEWLRQCGFEYEDKVNVFVSNEMLVIKKDKSADKEESSK